MSKRNSTKRSCFLTARYIRMSTDEQTDSPARQHGAIDQIPNKYNADLEFDDSLVFSDEGKKGWDENRGDFQRLIESARRGEFQVVAMDDLDRFSRMHAKTALRYVLELDACNVKMIDGKKGWRDNDSVIGLIQTLLELDQSHAESCTKSYRQVTSLMRDTKEGIWRWPAPYGYVIVNRRLARGHQSEVKVVRRIVRLYLAGHGMHKIACLLNDDGIPSPKGKNWSHNAVSNILTNENYTGYYVTGKFSRVSFEGATSPAPGQYIPDNHQALFSREEWALIQKRLAEPKVEHSRSKDRVYVLTGLIRCGRCVAAGRTGTMTGRTDSQTGYQKYFCVAHSHYKQCDGCTFREDFVLPMVVQGMQDFWFDEASQKSLKAAIRKQYEPASSGRSVKSLKKELNDLEAKMKIGIRNMTGEADPMIAAGMREVIQEQQRQVQDLQTEVKERSKPKNEINAAIAMAVQTMSTAFTELSEFLKEKQMAELKAALVGCIEHIVVETRRVKGRGRYLNHEVKSLHIQLKGGKTFNVLSDNAASRLSTNYLIGNVTVQVGLSL